MNVNKNNKLELLQNKKKQANIDFKIIKFYLLSSKRLIRLL